MPEGGMSGSDPRKESLILWESVLRVRHIQASPAQVPLELCRWLCGTAAMKGWCFAW